MVPFSPMQIRHWGVRNYKEEDGTARWLIRTFSQEMAFVISKNQPSFSEKEAEKVNHSEGRDDAGTINSVTSHLYLKSSSSSSAHSSETLDKDVILRRIRHHKCLNKVRTTFQALVNSSSSSAHEHKWLEVNDAFSGP
ncbi:hypothetical protein F0562_003856 [Nyssa sinensis]|uniref:Uncharacterized protein n=1 Tax=Nyssa sinensis TaxID=561372 RepID=A0A5J5BZG0_9ASTE|nr:hypothetical protein F0562_003856 [Nyssa sinensis]